MTAGHEVPLPPDWLDRVARYPADGGPSGADWIRTVPGRIDEALTRWDLVVDGPPATGWTAVVIPVRRGEESLALKVGWPHTDGAHEHLVLRTWSGRGAVRLIAADPGRGLLLLERLDASRDLRSVDLDTASRIIGGLIGRLGIPAPPQIPRIAPYLEPHLERMRHREGVPRRVTERTLALARDLFSTPTPETLLHTDLHHENVLASDREPWLAIDPKSLAGHPGFEFVPMLPHQIDESTTSVRHTIRRQLAIAADAAGVDIDEALAWSLMRAGLELSWAVEMGDTDEVTRFVTLGKALDE